MQASDQSPVAIPDAGHRLERRAKIASLQAHMEGLDEAEKLSIEAMTHHHFASGAYVREMRIPAGVLVVGKLHKTEHIAILMQGKVTITSETGSTTFEAPCIMVAPPGTKRVAYAHTDSIWASVHKVGDERDLQVIEDRLIAKNFEELEALNDAAAARCVTEAA